MHIPNPAQMLAPIDVYQDRNSYLSYSLLFKEHSRAIACIIELINLGGSRIDICSNKGSNCKYNTEICPRSRSSKETSRSASNPEQT